LALEGPAAEILRDILDSSDTAYQDIWTALARRFGPLDEPRDAMRHFDARRQEETETLAEFEQSLRTLYREAWPNATSEQKDLVLKRKFEEDLASRDMAQYLRLHAKDDDFSATVLKARHFSDVAGTGRQKKVVRILETPASDTHQVSMVNHPPKPDWTPLLEGFKQVMSKALQPLQKAISTAKGNESNSRPSTPVADANTARQSPGTPSPLQMRRFDRNLHGKFGPHTFQSRGCQFGLQRPPSTGGWQGRYTPPLRHLYVRFLLGPYPVETVSQDVDVGCVIAQVVIPVIMPISNRLLDNYRTWCTLTFHRLSKMSLLQCSGKLI